MSLEFYLRLIGMAFFGIWGVFWGKEFALTTNLPSPAYVAIVFGLLGALGGLILTPYFTTRPLQAARKILIKVPGRTLVAGIFGMLLGLGTAALLTLPISLLPSPFNKILPFVAVVVFTYLGVMIFVVRQDDLFAVMRSLSGGWREREKRQDASRLVLLDSSVLIDGRVVDIARTGFLTGTLVIPRFVLQEVQYVADSADPLRRQRGRRGLTVVSELQQDPNITVQISDMDVEGVRKVDDKLVVLARQLRCPILTNDYNLNRVAELQGVPVLNINELANAVKALYLPGESLRIKVIQEGKEPDQGVGYLDDGTMVVIEEGHDYIGKEIDVIVTKALQTAAGRMLFAKPKELLENGTA
ncbi:MAG: TRAM domain-containing protein [Chloroflexi bacterium]|nr:TRAM domain-containing protein [Chloroflexota bacterium]